MYGNFTLSSGVSSMYRRGIKVRVNLGKIDGTERWLNKCEFFLCQVKRKISWIDVGFEVGFKVTSDEEGENWLLPQ